MSDKVGYLPSVIRLDNRLPPLARLIYSELNSDCNVYDISSLSVKDISELFSVAEKTVRRSLNDLRKYKYVSNTKSGIKIKNLGQPKPANLEYAVNKILKKWNKFHDSKFGDTITTREHYTSLIEDRLATFSLEQILYAVESRYQHTKDDSWYIKNQRHLTNLDLIIRSDKELAIYVELPLPNPNQVKAFKNEKGNKDILD